MSIQAVPSPGLLTDLYQLTMAYGYWRSGMADHDAVFHLFFRKNPFRGGYAIAAGLEQALTLLGRWGFDDEALAYLADLTGNDGAPLFSADFLAWLRDTPLRLDIDAIPEGTAVFPHAPLLRVRGSLIQAQLLETVLLTLLNFETLIATKAARVCHAAAGDAVLEFGLRRAQGIDGGLSASRAAYVGGCSATSNVLAGRLFGIPVKGTHAHSWVMAFPDEDAAFAAYAAAMPNNCIFLVDTYDTLEGVRAAVRAGQALRARGHRLVGVRLDSGDLAALSRAARQILDEGGFPDAAVVASDSLDEHRILELKAQGARIDIWGVGTNLVTARDQPALGGVYKLAAIRAPGSGTWAPRIKLSEQPIKVSNPGIQQVRRYIAADGTLLGDVLYQEGEQLDAVRGTFLDPSDLKTVHTLPDAARSEDLLVPVLRGGQRVYTPPPLADVQARARAQVAALPGDLTRLDAPPEDTWPLGLSAGLAQTKARLLAEHGGAPT